MNPINRRRFCRELGISTAALPLVTNLPGLRASMGATRPDPTTKRRLIFMISPNGTLPNKFWPDEDGDQFKLKEIVEPLADYQDRLLFLKGVNNKVRGDGDSHMRGMSCLLTGIELFPGNIQGGSHTPAGWSSGISIDQEIRNFLQSQDATRTRFGSLEVGVNVPNRADPWTRWVYAGPNKPVAPIDDPYQLFEKLYGSVKDQASLNSILDELRDDLQRVQSRVGREDRRLLDEHLTLVREMESQLQTAVDMPANGNAPELEDGVANENNNMPKLSKMQIDLLVSALATDSARVGTLQFTRSVGNARMNWLGINDSHHQLSHDPDSNQESQDKLTKINVWFCQQLLYLVQSLEQTPEPDGEGSLLDHTTIVWTNELGKGNSHTLNDIPFLLVGNGLGFKMGRSLKYDNEPHNRLLLAFAHAMGHTSLETFGNPKLCPNGVLPNLV